MIGASTRSGRWRDAAAWALPLVLACSGPESVAQPGDPTAAPAEAPVAAPHPTELLRRLSFDLRGRPPSHEEYAQVHEAGAVPAELIEQMLASDDFLDQVVRWHSEILWPNISRYRVNALPITAVIQSNGSSTVPNGDMLGFAGNNPDATGGPDPWLVVAPDDRYVVAFEPRYIGVMLRGGRYPQQAYYCDSALEYPDPSVVGTPANIYEIPASESGSGQAYQWTYYYDSAFYETSPVYSAAYPGVAVDPSLDGMVMPYRDWKHCPNYCFDPTCSPADLANKIVVDEQGDHVCYADMIAAGDEPGGRHHLDRIGGRCPDGYERVINRCDYAAEFNPETANRHPFRKVSGQPPTSYNRMVDGWRPVAHYWSEGVPIQTCAVEAQQREVGLLPSDAEGRFDPEGTPQSCAVVRHERGWRVPDPSCGCGPGGAYCHPSHRAHLTPYETRAEHRFRTAVEQEPLQIIRSVVAANEDYLTILTTDRSFVNGPLALAWRAQWPALSNRGVIHVSPPVAEPLPEWEEIPYEDEAWHAYEREARHSGILTTLAFQLRFPTARSRVSQFYRSFLCSEAFDLAPAPDPTDVNPDISARSGCAVCHRVLEPLGMYFARYPDRTGVYLAPGGYTHVNEACRTAVLGPEGTKRSGGLHPECGDFYAQWDAAFTDVEAEYAGHLWPAVYRSAEMYGRMDEGPAAMVNEILAGGQDLQLCAAERVWDRLVGREPTASEREMLVSRFEAAGRSYRDLVEAVVNSIAYKMAEPPEVSP